MSSRLIRFFYINLIQNNQISLQLNLFCRIKLQIFLCPPLPKKKNSFKEYNLQFDCNLYRYMPMKSPTSKLIQKHKHKLNQYFINQQIH